MPMYSQNQIRVLQSTLIHKNRIEQGNLENAEKRLLSIVAAVEEYLKQYYPGKEITILGLDDVLFQKERLLFRACAENSVRFHIVTESKEEELSDLWITDNFGASLLAGEANRYVEQLLQDAGAVNVQTAVWLQGNIDGRLARAESMEALIRLQQPVQISGHVFLSASGNEHITEDRLIRLFSGRGLKGIVSFWKMDGLPEGDVQVSWAKDYCKPNGISAIRVNVE